MPILATGVMDDIYSMRSMGRLWFGSVVTGSGELRTEVAFLCPAARVCIPGSYIVYLGHDHIRKTK